MEQVATMDDCPCDMELDRTHVRRCSTSLYCSTIHNLPFSDVTLTFYVSGRSDLSYMIVSDWVTVRHAASDPRAFPDIGLHRHPWCRPLQLCKHVLSSLSLLDDVLPGFHLWSSDRCPFK